MPPSNWKEGQEGGTFTINYCMLPMFYALIWIGWQRPLAVIQLFYSYGNKRWCRKGRMEWEVVGGAGAGSACILDFNWFQTHNFFSFITQVKQKVSACNIIILHYNYNFHVSLFVNFWSLRRFFPESSKFSVPPDSADLVSLHHTIASWTKDKTYT